MAVNGTDAKFLMTYLHACSILYCICIVTLFLTWKPSNDHDDDDGDDNYGKNVKKSRFLKQRSHQTSRLVSSQLNLN